MDLQPKKSGAAGTGDAKAAPESRQGSWFRPVRYIGDAGAALSRMFGWHSAAAPAPRKNGINLHTEQTQTKATEPAAPANNNDESMRSDFFKTTRSAADDYELAALIEDSLIEAQCKERRIRDFFKNPHEDGSERWWMAEYVLDYMREFVSEEETRKDGFRQEALHMFDPVLECRGLLHAVDSNPESKRYGLPVLPREVTYEVTDDGRQRNVPPSMRSVEMLFITILLHDLDENYPKVSNEHLSRYLKDRIDSDTRLNAAAGSSAKAAEMRDALKARIPYIGMAMDAVTFGRKRFEKDGSVVKGPTHAGNIYKYLEAMQSLWMAIGTKAPDRINGLTTRYGRTPDFFTLPQDDDYIRETRIMFQQGRPLEKMMRRYPELASYFRIMNARMNIAYRCFSAYTDNHPNWLKYKPDMDKLKIDPESAVIDVREFVEDASIGTLESDPDCLSLVAMLEGFAAEAGRKPRLYNLYQQIEDQLQPLLDARYHRPAPSELETRFSEARKHTLRYGEATPESTMGS